MRDYTVYELQTELKNVTYIYAYVPALETQVRVMKGDLFEVLKGLSPSKGVQADINGNVAYLDSVF